MDLHVRQAVEADVPTITDVYRRAWIGAYRSDLEPDVLEANATGRAARFDWRLGIRSPDVEVLVAEVDGEITGVVQADEVLDPLRDLSEVTMLYVAPEAWGTGVAAALLTVATGWIVGRGHGAARLRVVDRHLRARRFYERNGWEVDPSMDPVPTELARLVYYRRPLP